MGKRRHPDEDTESTTAKLVRAAREMFREHGYAATSMDDLCARVGLTRGALYHHFGGKEGLLEEVVRQIHEEVGAELDDGFDSEPDKWQAFRGCCRRYLEMALDPEIQRIVFRDAPAVLGERLRQMDLESLEAITEALEEVMEQGHIVRTEAEPLARLLNGAMADAALWIAATDDPSAALERSVAAFELLLRGLETPSSRTEPSPRAPR